MSFEIFSLCRPSQRGAIPFEKISKITLILALRQELFIVMLPKLHFLLGFYPTVDLNELQQRTTATSNRVIFFYRVTLTFQIENL